CQDHQVSNTCSTAASAAVSLEKKRSARAGLFLCTRVGGDPAWRENALADAKREMKKTGACPTHNAASGGCVRKSHRRHDCGLVNRLS
ncbi:hypothetical protein, partial [Xanthomonas sp. A1809]|uniref:hypothetical protein n=1 Tax=Xanthomonas sp. A1809 TaxID=2821275 RepID=UPI001ADCE62A